MLTNFGFKCEGKGHRVINCHEFVDSDIQAYRQIMHVYPVGVDNSVSVSVAKWTTSDRGAENDRHESAGHDSDEF